MSCDKKPYGLGDSVRIGDHFDTCKLQHGNSTINAVAVICTLMYQVHSILVPLLYTCIGTLNSKNQDFC